MSTAISVENVSKSYRLGAIGGATLKADFARWWAKRRGRPDPLLRVGEEHVMHRLGQQFWALRDVSFRVREGEVLGVIGRNGAGKSTLLKILSQVTSPTSGEINIKGRIASLLEVGTGFHPELTGRENIFLNGAILGMTKVEIRRKFDEIVAFSGIEKFIDTPVKRYSSGMYVRLAFAVAAHLEPEILIVDEVLAVGDAEFQKKCLGKMQNVARGGRTVLFVSHNLGAVRQLCTHGLVLKEGRVVLEDTADRAVDKYLAGGETSGVVVTWEPACAPATDYMRFLKGYLLDERGNHLQAVDASKRFTICVEYEALRDTPNLRIGFMLQTSDGIPVCGSNDAASSEGRTQMAGHYRKYCHFPPCILNTGSYQLCFGADTPLFSGQPLVTDFCLAFVVEEHEGHGPRRERLPGLLRPKLEWQEQGGDGLNGVAVATKENVFLAEAPSSR